MSLRSGVISTTERSVEGFNSWTDVGGAVSSSVKSLPSEGSYTVTQTAPVGSYSIALYQNGRVTSVTRYDSLNSQLSSLNFAYDSHGHQSSVTDARTGTTSYAYNNADQIVSVTTPPPGTGGSAQTTMTTFDSMGRATNIVQADGTSVNNVFSKRGELVLTSGSRNYPVGYNYDAQGRMKNMTNWSTFSSLAGSRVTSWHYHPERGWLTNKLHADGLGTKYSYTAAGRLSTRLWARGITTTYDYDEMGGLQQLTYDDGATPMVQFAYTRNGQLESVARDSYGWKLFYNTNGQLISEMGSAGIFNNLRVTNTFDSQLRRSTLSLFNSSTLLTSSTHSYDTASRLDSVSDGTYSATYSYLANSPLVSQIVFQQSGNTRMTTTKQYDSLNRLQSISSVGTGSTPSVTSHTYSYNDANQRTRVNLSDGSFWIYDYDSLGQVKSGKRYWSDWTPVAGQQFEYGFDDIGNRNSTKAGGDSTGANLRSASYTANTLNQITQRDVPGYVNIVGAASATATNVNVNNVMAYRRGEYYRVELSTNNGSAAVWLGVTNRVVQNGTTNTVTGSVFVAKSPEVFSHDADGSPREIYERRVSLRLRAPEPAGRPALHRLLIGSPSTPRRSSRRESSLHPRPPAVGADLLRGQPIPTGCHPARKVSEDRLGQTLHQRTAEPLSHGEILTNDGHWAYVWDLAHEIEPRTSMGSGVEKGVRRTRCAASAIISRAEENRLTRLVAPTAIPTGARYALNFTNDWRGRRTSKVVSNWTGSAWSKSYEHKFVYDGWNLIATLDSANTLLYSFQWGTDLSGTMQGAGGVGGLVSMTVHSGASAGTYFYAFDGNGNVAALINAADGTVAARYEYGPFGELIRATGPMAFINPFRFSTKFQDDETGFLYYGYRYYDPSAGRWPSRDPIEEAGGVNLYAWVLNEGLGNWDALGLSACVEIVEVAYAYHGSMEIGPRSRPYLSTDEEVARLGGRIPLHKHWKKPGAAIAVSLDKTATMLAASLSAETDASKFSTFPLQMSTDLGGTVKVCASDSCCCSKVRASWRLDASASGTKGRAIATFHSAAAIARPNLQYAHKSGATEFDLNSGGCATFRFSVGEAWVTTSGPGVDSGMAAVSVEFECVE